MNRREFMVAASGVTGAGAAASAGTPVVAQEGDGTGNESGDTGGNGTDGDAGGGNGGATGGNETGNESAGNESAGGAGGGGGGTETVEVIDNEFSPDSLTIQPGTTVEWVWQDTTAQHNVHQTSQPDEANWEGHMPLESGNFSFESTFDVEGDYEYQCDPHVSQGMTGSITVTTDTGGGGGGEVDIHDIGVPIQKHWMGIATILAIFVSLVFTFYVLKYGESAHTSSPGRK